MKQSLLCYEEYSDSLWRAPLSDHTLKKILILLNVKYYCTIDVAQAFVKNTSEAWSPLRIKTTLGFSASYAFFFFEGNNL